MNNHSEYIRFRDEYLLRNYAISRLEGAEFNSSQGSNRNRLMTSYGLTNEELKLRTDISNLVQNKYTDVVIETFSTKDLESVLLLAAPKRIISYYNPSASLSAKSSSVQKQKAPKSRTNTKKTLKVAVPEVASIYANEQPNKRMKLREENEESDEYIAFVDSMPSETYRGPPATLYPVITSFLDYFFDLDYEPESVSFAFFALINSNNCHEFQLSDFAPESCSLAVIKSRITSRYYNSVDEFEADFRRMFRNVLTYYPRTHLAYSRATELLKVFEEKWTEAKQQIK